MNKARYIQLRVSKINSKSKIISRDLDNIFTQLYNIVIYIIYALLYSIKLNTELANTCDCR